VCDVVLARGGKPIIGIARRRNDNVSSFVRKHATDIVDTWREDHIVNAVKGYGDDYLANGAPLSQGSAPALPAEQPDAAVAPEPSPPTPEELEPPGRMETVREVLSREELGTYVPGALSSFSGKQPPLVVAFHSRVKLLARP
jgi:hypothetical protein